MNSLFISITKGYKQTRALVVCIHSGVTDTILLLCQDCFLYPTLLNIDRGFYYLFTVIL